METNNGKQKEQMNKRHTYNLAAIIIVIPIVLVAVETQLNGFIGESVLLKSINGIRMIQNKTTETKKQKRTDKAHLPCHHDCRHSGYGGKVDVEVVEDARARSHRKQFLNQQ